MDVSLKRLAAARKRIPIAPSPSAETAPEGIAATRALARRYLPDVIRLLAGIALAPDSEAALHTRMLCARQVVDLAGVLPPLLPAAPLDLDGDRYGAERAEPHSADAEDGSGDREPA